MAANSAITGMIKAEMPRGNLKIEINELKPLYDKSNSRFELQIIKLMLTHDNNKKVETANHTIGKLKKLLFWLNISDLIIFTNPCK
ncbi:hypothetical protein [Shewanella algae]|uniref:hypothetical protein n=1 Tax=Shewanella algae TaxID=38313 RepID=UPI001AACF223|nr:hypothetical protein [Shewanella algae]MBO2700113.1 hypothetical protein [Shewanella algae]